MDLGDPAGFFALLVRGSQGVTATHDRRHPDRPISQGAGCGRSRAVWPHADRVSGLGGPSVEQRRTVRPEAADGRIGRGEHHRGAAQLVRGLPDARRQARIGRRENPQNFRTRVLGGLTSGADFARTSGPRTATSLAPWSPGILTAGSPQQPVVIGLAAQFCLTFVGECFEMVVHGDAPLCRGR